MLQNAWRKQNGENRGEWLLKSHIQSCYTAIWSAELQPTALLENLVSA